MSPQLSGNATCSRPMRSARLNCSERTVRRLIDRGLPALRLGHRDTSIRIDAQELEAWLYADPHVMKPLAPYAKPAEDRGGPRSDRRCGAVAPGRKWLYGSSR